ncbi:MAG: coenzyme F420-0:L-glutamate ligase [Hydrogenophaga sp.]|uniref:coenzyme F420-0:L-glutamate ligase n=1 Tax=Hydrogenophaga sp. TaxID=1904254 RepID=UPI0026278A1B|nr:coenzyme F420-0:L-glutamate ligase [Hydrogenophaga sp.]MCW5668698.1 coenzyme F420-0:L-glutamate ligase [Hydrogenophaga sp.]
MNGSARLHLVAPQGLPEVREGDDLVELVLHACREVAWSWCPGDCVVLAQKVVSKAEGRRVALGSVTPSPPALELAGTTGKDPRLLELVLRESVRVVRAVRGLVITQHRLGHVFANAGVDQSNVPSEAGDECALLLPQDPDASARAIADGLRERLGFDVSVLIVDSFGRPWREGVCGTAIGVYGLPAVIDRRGKTDREGRPLQVTLVAHADEVAAAASLLMGQADEGRPLVLIRGLPFDGEAAGIGALHRTSAQDLFR